MVDPEVLIAMRFLPLRTRAERHSRQFGIKVTLVQLRAVYKKHQVRFRQPKLTTRLPDWKEAELIPKRILFAEKMLRMRERGRHIIYADESTFLATARPGKTWMAGVRMDVEKNHPQLQSITVYGAVTSSLAKPVFMTSHTTNAE